ncbi:MAG: glycosyltransferase [Candidatus Pacebacteria bacterium]|nr:glycosyltransferase [Candidatus Paceibacterota bacterium]MDD5356992.1 glycosyltransferase [Candidatus Paceibacterota bacterium]
MKDSVLVTLADSNFLEHAKQLFGSAHRRGSWQGDYCLIAYEVPENAPELQWFNEKNIFIHHVSNFLSIRGSIYSHPSVLGKFYLLTPFFRQWQHIVFLDADTMVRSSLQELSKLKGFWATEDMNAAPLSHQFTHPFFEPKKWDGQKQICFQNLTSKFDLRQRSFNTGVFTFSSDIIKDNSFDICSALISDFAILSKYGEQPIFNLYFYRNWGLLPETYNHFVPVSLSPEKTKEIMEKVEREGFSAIDTMAKEQNDIPTYSPKDFSQAVLHFAGFAVKPWKKESPFYDEWMENLKEAENIHI